MTAHIPAKRLAGFYFWYYAAIGALIPYLGLYLAARGLTPAQIGTALGLLAMTRVFAPYLWGWAADHSGQRLTVIRITLGCALLFFALLPLLDGALTITAAIVLYGMSANGTMAQFEVVTFSHLAAQEHRYASLRVWGSIGFVVTVLLLGPMLERLGVITLPWWIAAMFLVAWLIGWRVPSPPPIVTAGPATGVGQVLRRPEVIALLLACFFAQISFGPYYGFYSIYLEQHGHSKGLIGLLWALGVVAEVLVFWLIPRFLPKLPLAQMFMWSQAVTALRWVLTVWCVDAPLLMALVQPLHAVSFGFYHLAAVNLIQRLFPGALQGRGQALYIGVSYGLGGASGFFFSGWLWERVPQELIWYSASAVAMIAWWVAQRGLRSLK